MSKALEEMTEQVCGFLVKEHSSRQSEQGQRPWGLSTPEVQGQQKVSVAGQSVCGREDWRWEQEGDWSEGWQGPRA